MDGQDTDIHDRADRALRRNHVADRIGAARPERGQRRCPDTILWIIAAVLVVAGIVAIVRGALLWGILLIIGGLLVGPGGVSILD